MIKSTLKPLVLSAAVAAALVVLATPAYAVEAKISGQVNKGIMRADDGINSELFFVDIDNSSTRFRFTGSEDIGSGVKAGIVWEVEYQGNDSDKVTLFPLSKNTPGPTFGERKAEVYFSGPWGQVTLGQGDGAMNGGTEVDLSGTSVISYAGTADIGRAIVFRTAAGGAGPTLGSSVSQQDFESRYDRLRYDSPKLGPVTIAVSTGTSSGLDVLEYGVRFNVTLGGGNKLAGAFGMSSKDLDTVTPGSGGDQDTTGGSISWLSPMGWNVTFSTSNVENEAVPVKKDSDNTYVKLGYKTGPHAFSVDLGMGDDQAAIGDEGETKGFAYVYTASKAVELYGGYKVVSLDRPGTSFEDITIATVGSRIKF